VPGLLPPGFLQFLDSNGDPLAGGSVGYFDPASPGTLKPIFADQDGTVAVTNPVPLDQAGRPFSGGSEVGIWGTGQYRMTVRDAVGALQWSAITANVSDSSAIAAETAARIAGDQNLQTQIVNEVTRAQTAENNLQIAINSEASTRQAFDTNLQTEITNLQNEINGLVPPASSGNVSAMTGSSTTGSFGEVSIAWTAFTHHAVSLVLDVGPPIGSANIPRFTLWSIFANSATGRLEITDGTGTFSLAANVNFTWYASGY
jgi:hypothetical protein